MADKLYAVFYEFKTSGLVRDQADGETMTANEICDRLGSLQVEGDFLGCIDERGVCFQVMYGSKGSYHADVPMAGLGGSFQRECTLKEVVEIIRQIDRTPTMPSDEADEIIRRIAGSAGTSVVPSVICDGDGYRLEDGYFDGFAFEPWPETIATPERTTKTPKTIKVRREEGHHTDTVGRTEDGRQFMAFVVAAHADRPGWDYDNWFAVLHLFARDGVHIASRHVVTNDSSEADQLVRTFLEELGPHRLCDVAVRRFEVQLDGCTFGLITREDGRIVLVPNDLLFGPPWDGGYDT